ncbi:serine/threonine-protein kinase drkD [Phytophthora nicotianae]|uniref:Serine/threonine-protein kinase drkD n=1 Tax=Phytophthora nicotianae TaxID=4792 RepID=A0A0W8CW29_PHYNI|nr:serine/threonine-protein kinase drkD [Phytophthora nicotianae]
MAATKPSKKQRGKLKAAKARKETAKSHVKFDDNGDQVVPKKRARVIKKKNAEEVKEGGGKADRSPDMIQQANYYLEQWKKRNEPKADDELPWKFKQQRKLMLYGTGRCASVALQTIKQQWILRWMYEADIVPKSMFAIVLEYLNGIQGAARKRVMDSAQEIIDIGVPAKEEEEAAAEEKEKMLSIKLARRRYKRALQVAELLA